MDIVLAETGAPLPDAKWVGPSTLVKAGDTYILVNADRRVVMRLTAAGSMPVFLGGVLITHLHNDHVCVLNDIMTMHWVMTRGNGVLRMYGPPGTQRFLDRQLHALEDDIGYWTAQRLGAKRPVLAHMAPPPVRAQYPEWIARAAEHLDGEVVTGDDLTTITV